MASDRIRCMIFSLLLGMALSGCRPDRGGSPLQSPDRMEPTGLVLQEESVIVGADASPADVPFLSNIHRAASSPQGRLYLYDREQQKVLAYSEAGDFLFSLGREGSGPGEFRSVSSLLALEDGGLAAADRANAHISIFNGKGVLRRSATSLGIQAIQSMDQLPGGRFLLAGWHPGSGKMVHVADSALTGIQASFLPLEDLPSAGSSRREILLRSQAGHVKALGPGRAAFTPVSHDGRVFIFKEDGNSSWRATKTTPAIEELDAPLRISTQTAQSALEQYPPASILSYGFSEDRGAVSVIHALSRSYGLYLDSSGWLVHLSLHFTGNTIALAAERYDPGTGELLEYGRAELGRDSPLHPLAMDPDGRLLMEHTDSAYVVRMAVSGNL